MRWQATHVAALVPLLLLALVWTGGADASKCAGKKAYIAGPAVFYPDFGKAFYDYVRKVLGAHNVTPLIPIDNDFPSPTPGLIRTANIEMIEQSDVVLADLSPFRSLEPDAGTSFEVGYASALKTAVFTYTSDLRTMVEKYNGTRDEWGFWVEDFGLPFNLMLFDGTVIAKSFRAAFAAFMKSC